LLVSFSAAVRRFSRGVHHVVRARAGGKRACAFLSLPTSSFVRMSSSIHPSPVIRRTVHASYPALEAWKVPSRGLRLRRGFVVACTHIQRQTRRHERSFWHCHSPGSIQDRLDGLAYRAKVFFALGCNRECASTLQLIAENTSSSIAFVPQKESNSVEKRQGGSNHSPQVTRHERLGTGPAAQKHGCQARRNHQVRCELHLGFGDREVRCGQTDAGPDQEEAGSRRSRANHVPV
jgi:hypothetical protein